MHLAKASIFFWFRKNRPYPQQLAPESGLVLFVWISKRGTASGEAAVLSMRTRPRGVAGQQLPGACRPLPPGRGVAVFPSRLFGVGSLGADFPWWGGKYPKHQRSDNSLNRGFRDLHLKGSVAATEVPCLRFLGSTDLQSYVRQPVWSAFLETKMKPFRNRLFAPTKRHTLDD